MRHVEPELRVEHAALTVLVIRDIEPHAAEILAVEPRGETRHCHTVLHVVEDVPPFRDDHLPARVLEHLAIERGSVEHPRPQPQITAVVTALATDTQRQLETVSVDHG